MSGRLISNDPLNITQFIDRRDEGPRRVGTYTMAG